MDVSQTLAAWLERHPLFVGAPTEARLSLARQMTARRLKRGEILWEQGAPADEVVLIRAGFVALTRAVAGHQVTLDFLGRGELMGIAAGLHVHQAEVHEDVTLWSISRAGFDAWLVQHPQMVSPVLDHVTARVERLSERLAQVASHGAPARLSLVLLDLASRFGVRDGEHIIVNVRLTHRELASLIGSTRETVSVTFVNLREKKLVHTEKRQIVLLDLEGLESLAAA